MADLLVITPTRGRPESVRRLLAAWDETATGRADLLLCVDADDDTFPAITPRPWLYVTVGPRQRLVGWTNTAALDNLTYPYLASFGDDHVPSSANWQDTLCDALADLGTGFAYPNDLYEGETIPTAVAMTSDIVRTLGWMALPTSSHLYIDLAWRDLGQGIDRYRYLPDCVVEHLSTYNHKAPEDETSRDHWAEEAHARDAAAYNAWCREGRDADIEKLRALL